VRVQDPGEAEPSGLDGKPFTHVFFVLVHENLDCVVDLIRNLRFFDRDSPIVVYDGSGGSLLLTTRALERFGAVVHPAPKLIRWGRLHVFMFDCLEYALDRYAFDAVTVVDSDQLLVRRGYARALQTVLRDRPQAGVLATRHPTSNIEDDSVNPIVPERARWAPMIERFAYGGKQPLPLCVFWPGTVMTGTASAAVCDLRDDPTLAEILDKSGVASEEVVFSTLAALLGYEVLEQPWNDEWVRWHRPLGSRDVAEALADPACFWLHPVRRRHDDAARSYLRGASNEYQGFTPMPPAVQPAPARAPAPTESAAARWKRRVIERF
jgi:hypothetical protein